MSDLQLVVIGVGSNLPWQQKSSVAVVSEALRSLRTFASDRFVVSSLYQTSPVDCPAQSDVFINAAAAFMPRAGLTAKALLEELKSLERVFGRDRGRVTLRNAPRVLDLDVLVFGDQILDTPELILPHPRATQRAFVMIPLNEIVPDLVWPSTSLTVAELCASLASNEQVVRIARNSATAQIDG